MLKKVILGAVLGMALLSLGLFFWARAVFTQDHVRATLAVQLSKALGQPVVVGGIHAGIYPRITVNLTDVAIGEPARIRIATLHVDTDLRAMLSRRIEHAALRLSGARIELPLPEFVLASGSGTDMSSSPPAVELVSIDEIVLSDVEIISGGRTLRGDVELVPQDQGVLIRRATLVADNTTIDISGQIAELSGPSGELTVKAGTLNFDEVLAFVSAFASGAGITYAPSKSAPKPATPSAMNIGLSLESDSATFGTLVLQKLSGRARVTPDAIVIEPVGFGLFGGKYDGALALSLGDAMDFRLKAALSDVDMASAMAFVGSPGTMTGRLTGTIDLSGRVADAAGVVNSSHGRARVDITNGTIKNLGLVRTVVIATSGRGGAPTEPPSRSRDEPFARLGATLAIARGIANTNDLRFESNDLLLAAAGHLRLDGKAINLAGQVQLSDALSQQAGRDLVRYTQQQGRVTLPATITGAVEDPQVHIDVTSLVRRALENKAREEVQGAIKKRLGGLFGK